MYLWRAGHRLRLFSSSYERQEESSGITKIFGFRLTTKWNISIVQVITIPGGGECFTKGTPLLQNEKVSWYCDNLERRGIDEQTRQRRPNEGNSKIPRNIEDIAMALFRSISSICYGALPINDHLEYAIRTRFLRVSISAAYSSFVHSGSVQPI